MLDPKRRARHETIGDRPVEQCAQIREVASGRDPRPSLSKRFEDRLADVDGVQFAERAAVDDGRLRG